MSKMPNAPRIPALDPSRNTSTAGLSMANINKAATEAGRLNNAKPSTVPSYGGRANNPGQRNRSDRK